MKNPPISPMEVIDLDQVLTLAEQLGYPNDLSEFQQRFDELKSLSNHALLVLRDKHKISGWIHLEVVQSLIKKPMVEIKALVVDESQRGQGGGKALVDYAKKWAKDQGLSAIYLTCNIIREKTHKFYEREGFHLSKTSHLFVFEL